MHKGEVAAAGGIAMDVGSAFKSLGVSGAQDELQHNYETNLAERNQRERMTKEDYAMKCLGRMGVNPGSGSAIMALAEIETGIERVNKANASVSALSQPGGVEALNVGAGSRSTQEESSKLAYGENMMRVAGGELNAITISSAAGSASGVQASGAVIGTGKEAINSGLVESSGHLVQGDALNNLTTASELSSAQELRSALTKGKEVNNTKDGFLNALKSSELQATSDIQGAMSTGEHGKVDDYRTLAQQNAEVAAKNVSDIVKKRGALGGKDAKGNPVEAWSADKVAEGMAIKSVEGEATMMGAVNALTNDKGTDNEAFRRVAAGSMEKGRAEQNSLLGIGKEWASKSEAEKIAYMSKVQDNAAFKELGGITAAHKAIEQAGSLDKAIGVGNTLAAAKAGSDIAAISKFNNPDEFIDNQIQLSSAKASADKQRYDKSHNKDIIYHPNMSRQLFQKSNSLNTCYPMLHFH